MTEKCRCDRCGRIRDLFQYTKWEEDRFIDEVVNNGPSEDPQFTTRRVNLAERRGLCEECAVEVNKAWYDIKCDNACGFQRPYGWVPEAGCEVHDAPTKYSFKWKNKCPKVGTTHFGCGTCSPI